jgi:hypothetical protein
LNSDFSAIFGEDENPKSETFGFLYFDEIGFFRIFPCGFIGRESTNSTDLGALYDAMCFLQKPPHRPGEGHFCNQLKGLRWVYVKKPECPVRKRGALHCLAEIYFFVNFFIVNLFSFCQFLVFALAHKNGIC